MHRLPSVTDDELEQAIESEYEAMLRSPTMRETRERLERMHALLDQRSEAKKNSMERQMGLA
jgi:hypothetical protein